MKRVSLLDAQKDLDRLLKAIRSEPVMVTQHDQPIAVIVSPERFVELEALEDAVWAARARAAAQNGSIGVEATARFIEKALGAEA